MEWYDFFIYATMAGLVFSQLFFEPAGTSIGLLLSFASVGISFLFRPLGAFLAGHYGDKLGRRVILVVTLITSIRFSGVSISYAIGAILGGAFAPMIAQALLDATGSSGAIAVYLVGMCVVALIAVTLVRDRSGIDLSIHNQAEQEVGCTVFDQRPVPAAREMSLH